MHFKTKTRFLQDKASQPYLLEMLLMQLPSSAHTHELLDAQDWHLAVIDRTETVWHPSHQEHTGNFAPVAPSLGWMNHELGFSQEMRDKK